MALSDREIGATMKAAFQKTGSPFMLITLTSPTDPNEDIGGMEGNAPPDMVIRALSSMMATVAHGLRTEGGSPDMAQIVEDYRVRLVTELLGEDPLDETIVQGANN